MLSMLKGMADGLSSDPLTALRRTAQVLSEAAGAWACYIFAREGDDLSLIVSSSGARVIPDRVAIDIAATNRRGVVLSAGSLREGFGAVMCVPIMAGRGKKPVKQERRRSSEKYAGIMGYLYFQAETGGDRAFSDGFLDACESVEGYIEMVLDYYLASQEASADKLTGALNRKYTDIALEECHKKAEAENGRFAVLMADIDYFKQVNDTFGHLEGDKVLRAIADVLRSRLRDGDILGRYGGEEFITILPGMSAGEAYEAAELIRLGVKNAKILGDRRDLTISIGVSAYPEHAEDAFELVGKADIALYAAKEAGKNRCVVWSGEFSEIDTDKHDAPEFFTGDAAEDGRRVLSLYRLMEIPRYPVRRDERMSLALDEVLNISGAAEVAYFDMKDGEPHLSHHISSPGRELPRYNEKALSEAAGLQKTVSIIDEGSEGGDAYGWHSVVCAPAVIGGRVRGVLYAAVPVRQREFGVSEVSFISSAAVIVGTY